MEKYKEVVPVFIESHSKDIVIPQEKILMKKNYTVAQFGKVIKKQSNNKEDAVLYFYSNGKILKPCDTFDHVYEKNKSEDGFLYMRISEVPALG